MLAVARRMTPDPSPAPKSGKNLLAAPSHLPCPWHTAAMTRRAALLLLLAVSLGWLAYQTWPPQWQERLADRAAITRCKDIRKSEHLDVAAIRARHARCAAMEAAFQKKW